MSGHLGTSQNSSEGLLEKVQANEGDYLGIATYLNPLEAIILEYMFHNE